MHLRQQSAWLPAQAGRCAPSETQIKAGTFALTQSTSILPSSLAPTKDLASSRGLEGRKTSTELTATWGGFPGEEAEHRGRLRDRMIAPLNLVLKMKRRKGQVEKALAPTCTEGHHHTQLLGFLLTALREKREL